MSFGAKVSSIEALESFRSSLVLYLSRSRCVLEDVAQEIVRARIWLETDRQVYWKQQIRLRTAAAAQAEQELMTARLSGEAGAILERKQALAKARDALGQAEAGRERVRRWLQRYPTDVEARGALPRRLQHLLSHDASRAVSFLEQAAVILTDYAGQGTGAAATAASTGEPPACGADGQPAVPAVATLPENRADSQLGPSAARSAGSRENGTGARTGGAA